MKNDEENAKKRGGMQEWFLRRTHGACFMGGRLDDAIINIVSFLNEKCQKAIRFLLRLYDPIH